MILRRRFLSTLAAPLGIARAASSKPNVVIILADDMGWGDVGMNGCPDIRTPVIDSIAAQGVRFTQFYASAPECTPTRCALLTGRYPQRVGGLECAIGVNNIGRYDEAEWLQKKGELGLPASELTMGTIFRNGGYDTAIIGKWHLGYDPKHWPDKHGFSHTFINLGGNADYFTHVEQNEGAGHSHLYENGRKAEPKGYLTDVFADKAIDWLKQRKDQPFFLYLPFTAPHVPIQDPDDFDAKTGTAPHRNRDRKAYAAVVQRLDRSIGAVLRQLEDSGAAKNTIVVFMSDNGADINGRNEPWRGRKSSVYEGGIRVPCAIRWPAGISAGKTVDQVALTMDILPTLLAAAGVGKPANRKLDGINLLPVLQGTAQPVERTVFWRYKRARNRRKAVRDGRWKYTNDSGAEALFDLGADLKESADLIAKQPEIADRLRAKLAAWEKEVEAPRLRDFRPA